MGFKQGLVMRCTAICAWAAVLIYVPVTTALAVEDVSITLESRTLNGRAVLAGGKSLRDGAVLITHGTLAHSRMEIIDAMQAALAERGLNSLAISLSLGLDNRRGMYDCKTPHRHRHTGALNEIGAWIKWLKSKGAGSIVLMGHSRGGNQTAWFAAERPNPAIAKIVLLAPMTWKRESAAAAYQKQYNVPLGQVLDQAKKLAGEGKGDTRLEKTGFLYCKDATVTASSFLSYYEPDQRRHTPALFDKIDAPVLVIAGSQDKVVKGLIEDVKPFAEAGKVRLLVVEDADHYFRDLYAEDVADGIDAFLR